MSLLDLAEVGGGEIARAFAAAYVRRLSTDGISPEHLSAEVLGAFQFANDRGRKPVALLVDEAHDLHAKTLIGLKRLMEVVADSGGMLSVVLVGHPKLRNDLRRPTLEEIGYRCHLRVR